MIRVLFDNNMLPSIARALHQLVSVDGHECWALREKFDCKIEDIDLFNALDGERNWIVISKDVANAKRKP